MSENETKAPINYLRLSAWEKYIPKWRDNDKHGDNGLVLEFKIVSPSALKVITETQYSDDNEKMLSFLRTLVRVKHSIILVDDSVSPEKEMVIDSIDTMREYGDTNLIREVIEKLHEKAGVVGNETLKK